MTDVYAAFRSYPDYHAPPPALHSLHDTLEGAIKALYPDRPDFQQMFRASRKGEWDGPDGFGLVKLMPVAKLEDAPVATQVGPVDPTRGRYLVTALRNQGLVALSRDCHAGKHDKCDHDKHPQCQCACHKR